MEADTHTPAMNLGSTFKLVPLLVLLALPVQAARPPFDLFNDPELDTLVRRAVEHNQDLAAAAARVSQARALGGAARAEFYPQLALDAFAGRQRSLESGYRASDYASLPGFLSWEIDLWGRLRKSNAAARSEARAVEALYASARLSLAAEVAETFYSLRAAQWEHGTLLRTLDARRRGHRIVADRAEIGTSSPLDLARAETELAAAEAALAEAKRAVAQLTHALDVLVARDPEERVIEAARTVETPASLPSAPPVPANLNATVLLNRPDVAAAQLSMDAASARIGVARTAFFPAISLTGSAGWESTELSGFVSADHRVWSFGPRLYLPLFQGGRLRANLARAQAVFVETSANYRQTLLLAMREVRDALAVSRYLDEQISATQRMSAAARRAAELSHARYDAGSVSYLEVVESERSALDAERALHRLRGQRLVAAASLIRALGGSLDPDAPGARDPQAAGQGRL